MKDKGKSKSEGLKAKAETLADPRGGVCGPEKAKRSRRHVTVTERAVRAKARADKKAAVDAAEKAAEVAAAQAEIAAFRDRAPTSAETKQVVLHQIVKRQRKARRKAEQARTDAHRGDVLARLLMNGRIDRNMFVAGAHLRQLWLEGTPGVSAMDFTRERVDGGKGSQQGPDVTWIGRHAALVKMIDDSGMGDDAALVLRMICRDDMMPAQVAHELESDEAAKRQGGATRDTQALVRYCLRSGLNKVFRVLTARKGNSQAAVRSRVWQADGLKAAGAWRFGE